MGGGYGGLTEYLGPHRKTEMAGGKQLSENTVDELYKMLVSSSDSCRGGDAAECVVKHALGVTDRISAVYRPKVIDEICALTRLDAGEYSELSNGQLMQIYKKEKEKNLIGKMPSANIGDLLASGEKKRSDLIRSIIIEELSGYTSRDENEYADWPNERLLQELYSERMHRIEVNSF